MPYDLASSNTPGCVLDFSVCNVSSESQHVSFWGLLKNAAGYDHPERPGRRIGHLYAARFADAGAVLSHLCNQGPALLAATRKFLDASFETSLPGWMLDAVNAQFSPLMRTAWLDAAGRLPISTDWCDTTSRPGWLRMQGGRSG